MLVWPPCTVKPSGLRPPSLGPTGAWRCDGECSPPLLPEPTPSRVFSLPPTLSPLCFRVKPLSMCSLFAHHVHPRSVSVPGTPSGCSNSWQGFLFLRLKTFYWSTVDLQCCVNFCCTAKWLSYTYISFFIFFSIIFFSVIHIHVSILFQILFPFRLLQSIEQSSLFYTVGPCWLSILNIPVCTCQSQTPDLPLPAPFPPRNHKLVL